MGDDWIMNMRVTNILLLSYMDKNLPKKKKVIWTKRNLNYWAPVVAVLYNTPTTILENCNMTVGDTQLINKLIYVFMYI